MLSLGILPFPRIAGTKDVSGATTPCGGESNRLVVLCQQPIHRAVNVISLQGREFAEADTQVRPGTCLIRRPAVAHLCALSPGAPSDLRPVRSGGALSHPTHQVLKRS
jgi:hypothetical protein